MKRNTKILKKSSKLGHFQIEKYKYVIKETTKHEIWNIQNIFKVKKQWKVTTIMNIYNI